MHEESKPESVESQKKREDSKSAPIKSIASINDVDQEMADEYGFTPQQAREMGLYL